jgi:hypothetical protein
MKRSLLLVLLLVVALLAALRLLLRDNADAPLLPDASGGPAFEMWVIKPRMARPVFGILPKSIEEKLEAGAERRFDLKSPGAAIVHAAPNRLELRANDWTLSLEANHKGEIDSATYLVYTMMLAERQRTLRCRPADRPVGYLRAAPRPGSRELDGRFLVELAACENEETGKVVQWPPAPLTLRGSFARLPQSNVNAP